MRRRDNDQPQSDSSSTSSPDPASGPQGDSSPEGPAVHHCDDSGQACPLLGPLEAGLRDEDLSLRQLRGQLRGQQPCSSCWYREVLPSHLTTFWLDPECRALLRDLPGPGHRWKLYHSWNANHLERLGILRKRWYRQWVKTCRGYRQRYRFRQVQLTRRGEALRQRLHEPLAADRPIWLLFSCSHRSDFCRSFLERPDPLYFPFAAFERVPPKRLLAVFDADEVP